MIASAYGPENFGGQAPHTLLQEKPLKGVNALGGGVMPQVQACAVPSFVYLYPPLLLSLVPMHFELLCIHRGLWMSR